MITLFQIMIMTTLVLSLAAFATTAVTLRRPLASAFAWIVFAVYFGITVLTLDLLVL